MRTSQKVLFPSMWNFGMSYSGQWFELYWDFSSFWDTRISNSLPLNKFLSALIYSHSLLCVSKEFHLLHTFINTWMNNFYKINKFFIQIILFYATFALFYMLPCTWFFWYSKIVPSAGQIHSINWRRTMKYEKALFKVWKKSLWIKNFSGRIQMLTPFLKQCMRWWKASEELVRKVRKHLKTLRLRHDTNLSENSIYNTAATVILGTIIIICTFILIYSFDQLS